MRSLALRLVHAVRQNLLLRKGAILAWHVLGIGLTYYVAFLLRFDGAIPARFLHAYEATLLPLIAVNIAAFAGFRLRYG